MATKKTSNVMDLLLNSADGALKKPQKEVELPRLTKLFGEPFIVTCEALDVDQMDIIQENSMVLRGKEVDLNMNEMQIFTILEGVKEPNLKDKELRAKFKAPTPKELVRKLFLSGEITKLYQVVSELSGYNDEAIQEVKN